MDGRTIGRPNERKEHIKIDRVTYNLLQADLHLTDGRMADTKADYIRIDRETERNIHKLYNYIQMDERIDDQIEGQTRKEHIKIDRVTYNLLQADLHLTDGRMADTKTDYIRIDRETERNIHKLYNYIQMDGRIDDQIEGQTNSFTLAQRHSRSHAKIDIYGCI